MGTILTYAADRRGRRGRAALPREGSCQILIFTGVRIDRTRPDRPDRPLPPAPTVAQAPKPGRGA
ncbi:hypothetical protein [Kaistia adipata]|uniref:hypothetical protein n=1 Tax=Kaistia adipata TaxID=166954 RepID=UPI0003FDE02F|nr:hypothetical protein [Kaistia adipata]